MRDISRMSTASIQVVRHLFPRQTLAALEKDRSTHSSHHQAWLHRITRTCMSAASIQVVCQLLRGQALAGVQGHRHIYPKSICRSKLWRQVPVVQRMLHAHEAIGLPRGQSC